MAFFVTSVVNVRVFITKSKENIEVKFHMIKTLATFRCAYRGMLTTFNTLDSNSTAGDYSSGWNDIRETLYHKSCNNNIKTRLREKH